MKRSDTITLDEFRELTKDMDGKTAIMVTMPSYALNYALAVRPYHFETSLSRQGVLLLEPDLSRSVEFSDD